MTFFKRAYSFLFAATMLLIADNAFSQSQSKSSGYLFHFNPFKNERPAGPPHARRIKVLLDYGLVSQFCKTDPNYTSGEKGDGAYTLGAKLEIPILQNSSILVGGDFVKESFDFYSYYFGPGYSFLYNSNNEIYNHAIDMDELDIPIEYKMYFTPETRNTKTFFLTLGWTYRYIFNNNSLITNGTNDAFVWEGQNDITSVFQLFSPQGSSMLNVCLGYQHNSLRTGNAWFFEIEYKYGFSPLMYVGNPEINSNSIQFTLNTLAFKLGIRI